jgi:hypothetical protein
MGLRVLIYCLLGGLPLTIAALGAGNFWWWWLSGILLAAAFVPLATFGPRGVTAQFAVILPVLLIVSLLCTWSEALLFAPGTRQHPLSDLIGGAVLYGIAATALAALGWALKLRRPSTWTVERRPIAGTASMVLLCAFAYVVYYLIFGAIAYQFFTRDYYPEAARIVERLGLWFWVIQIWRGVLMTMAVVPVIFTLRMSRRDAAISVGMLLWIAGGVAPLVVPNDVMGTAQRFIHIAEILTQNALLGITAVVLLRPKPGAVASSAVVA